MRSPVATCRVPFPHRLALAHVSRQIGSPCRPENAAEWFESTGGNGLRFLPRLRLTEHNSRRYRAAGPRRPCPASPPNAEASAGAPSSDCRCSANLTAASHRWCQARFRRAPHAGRRVPAPNASCRGPASTRAVDHGHARHGPAGDRRAPCPCPRSGRRIASMAARRGPARRVNDFRNSLPTAGMQKETVERAQTPEAHGHHWRDRGEPS